MTPVRLSALCLLLAACPAAAQLSPSPGVLTLPKPGAASQAPAAPPTPPHAAPVTPVQQVAPNAGSLPHAKSVTAGHKPAAVTKSTPVVRPPPNAHAQRPAAVPTAGPAPAAASTPAVPLPLPAKPVDAGAPQAIGDVTKLPLPRWAALRSDEVNLRVGPGTRFPIEWQYHRRDLPVHILDERQVWRLIQDQDGVKGWVHQATLVGHRGFVVQGKEAVLRHAASNDAAPVALLKPGVVGRIRGCDAGAPWCEMQVGEYRGWLRRDQVWGLDPAEAVGG